MMKEIGEQEGVNYYRTWIEDDVWKLLRYGKKWQLFHEVNKGWVYPIIGIESACIQAPSFSAIIM